MDAAGFLPEGLGSELPKAKAKPRTACSKQRKQRTPLISGGQALELVSPRQRCRPPGGSREVVTFGSSDEEGIVDRVPGGPRVAQGKDPSHMLEHAFDSDVVCGCGDVGFSGANQPLHDASAPIRL